MNTFEVKSGKLVLTDPCSMGPVVEDVANGLWEASVEVKDCGSWGKRVASLTANLTGATGGRKMLVNGTVGVDSGQAGIFDKGAYDNALYTGDEDEFYEKCCMVTSGSKVGFVEEGALSSTGYGDGGYEATKWVKDGKVIRVQITFIGEGE